MLGPSQAFILSQDQTLTLVPFFVSRKKKREKNTRKNKKIDFVFNLRWIRVLFYLFHLFRAFTIYYLCKCKGNKRGIKDAWNKTQIQPKFIKSIVNARRLFFIVFFFLTIKTNRKQVKVAITDLHNNRFLTRHLKRDCFLCFLQCKKQKVKNTEVSFLP